MSIEVEHDWQAVFRTPKPKLGERAKTRLLLLLCLLWVSFGLIGHGPWKPFELQSISVIKHVFEGGDWTVPLMAGTPYLDKPPLYYLSAAAIAKPLSSLLPLHDAARLATGIWISLTLLLVGMAGRELWGVGSGRQSTLIFLSSIGLVFSAHTLNADVSTLCGYAMIFYGLALAPRKPLRSGVLLGTGVGIGFLSKGLQPVEVAVTTALLLPLLFFRWRRPSHLLVIVIAVVAALPWVLPWLISLKQSPVMFHLWLAGEKSVGNNIFYFLKTLSWFSWPALPLAAWSLWKLKPDHASVQICVLFFLVLLVTLGINAENRDIHALPFLIPLALLATPAVDTLRRGAASALDWFGVMLFGSLGFLVWLGWFAMMTGIPEKLSQRMHKLSLAYMPVFQWVPFILAFALTLTWAAVVFKTNKRTNRSAVTDWAMGMTMAWGLVMTLWMPWLDATKSYQSTLESMRAALPAQYGCIVSRNVGDSQKAAIDYYAGLRVHDFGITQSLNCDLYLIEDDRGRDKIDPGPDWKLLWEGKRPSDRRESFRLFQRVN